MIKKEHNGPPCPAPSPMFFLSHLAEDLMLEGYAPLCFMCAEAGASKGNCHCTPLKCQDGVKRWLVGKISKYAQLQAKYKEDYKTYFDFLDGLGPGQREQCRLQLHRQFPELNNYEIEAICSAWEDITQETETVDDSDELWTC